MPNQPKTPTRTFRIPDEIYFPAQAAAKANNETVTDVIQRALVAYTKRSERKQAQEPKEAPPNQ